MKKIFLIITIAISFIACKQEESHENHEHHDETVIKEEDNLLVINNQSVNEDRVLSLLRTNCFNCHNPDMGESRVAPPLFKVREHYYDETTKEEFVVAIINFINNPTEENAIMPGAVRNFGLIHNMSFNEEDLQLIAECLYDNDV